jgi:hypothetical protein
MSDDTETTIPPALTESEWAEVRDSMADPEVTRPDMVLASYMIEARGNGQHAKLIALANAALPDSDPRKITDGEPVMLRGVADVLAEQHGNAYAIRRLRMLADALASYLPPE